MHGSSLESVTICRSFVPRWEIQNERWQHPKTASAFVCQCSLQLWTFSTTPVVKSLSEGVWCIIMAPIGRAPSPVGEAKLLWDRGTRVDTHKNDSRPNLCFEIALDLQKALLGWPEHALVLHHSHAHVSARAASSCRLLAVGHRTTNSPSDAHLPRAPKRE